MFRYCTVSTVRKTLLAYLDSDMFKNDVFVGLEGLWDEAPDVRIYECVK